MNESEGALILGDEGATFWIPKDKLQTFLLDENAASAARAQLEPTDDAADDDVVGFGTTSFSVGYNEDMEEEEPTEMSVPTVSSSMTFRAMPSFYGNFDGIGRR